MKNGAKNIELKVELDHDLRDDEDENMLVIERGKHHHLFEKLDNEHGPHTISWTLSGNAASGEFCSLHDPDNPGFSWLFRVPGEKVFQNLHREGKKQVVVENHHRGKDTEGHWHYQLFARFGDKVYGVPITFTCGPSMNSNPSIKNT